jgi:hypothetical protein
MAKRKTIDGEIWEEKVTRRSTRLKTAPKEEEVPSHEDVKPVKKGKAVKKATPVKDEEEEVKVRGFFIRSSLWLIFILSRSILTRFI